MHLQAPLPKVASVTECAPRARAGAWGHTRSHTPLRAHSAHRVGALEALALEPGRWSSRRRGGDGLHHALHKNIINIHTSRQNCVRSLTTNSRASSLDSSAPHEGRKHERCARVRPRAATPSPGSIECRQGEVHRKKMAQQAISAHTRCNGDFGVAFLRSLKQKRSSNPLPDKSFRMSKGFPSGLASNLLLCGVPSEGRPGFVGSARVSCSSCHACSRAGKSSGDSRL